MLIDMLIVRLVDWLVDSFGWMVDWLIDWLIAMLIVRLVDWLVDWCLLFLQEAKAAGRQAFYDMTKKLQELADQLGKCIPKSRPYYEARVELKKVSFHIASRRFFRREKNAARHTCHCVVVTFFS